MYEHSWLFICYCFAPDTTKGTSTLLFVYPVVCTCDCDDSCELSLSRVLRIDMICLMNRSTSVVSCPHLSSAVLVLFCWLVNAYNKEGDRSVNTKKIVQNSVADLECSLFR